MGSHPDNGIVHALHNWKARAIRAERRLADHKAEELLGRVIYESSLLCNEYTIDRGLLRDIEQHLAGED